MILAIAAAIGLIRITADFQEESVAPSDTSSDDDVSAYEDRLDETRTGVVPPEEDSAGAAQPHGEVPKKGEPAPDFRLKRLNDHMVSLSGYRGRVVVLNFWATWCAPCREEIPDLIDVQRDNKLTVLGISRDEEGGEVVEPSAEEFPINYPLLANGLPVAYAYGAHLVVPTTVVVDREGNVYERYLGMVTEDFLRSPARAPPCRRAMTGHEPVRISTSNE